jgi:hypothetical protein
MGIYIAAHLADPRIIMGDLEIDAEFCKETYFQSFSQDSSQRWKLFIIIPSPRNYKNNALLRVERGF